MCCQKGSINAAANGNFIYGAGGSNVDVIGGAVSQSVDVALNIAAPGSQQLPIGSDVVTLPEPGGELILLADNDASARGLTLSRGSYRITGTMPAGVDRKMIMNKIFTVPMEGEQKRVFIHKFDAINNNDPFKPGAKFTAVITVIDNPIPLVPIIWGASAVATLVSSYFLVDKVQQFTVEAEPVVSKISTAVVLALILGVVITISKIFSK